MQLSLKEGGCGFHTHSPLDLRKFYVASALCLLLSYICDCMDGYYARRYDMTSQCGDWLDHLSDWALGAALFACIAFTPSPFKYTKLVLYILSLLLMSLHFKCQETFIGGSSDSIDFITKPLTCNKPEQKLPYTRYAGAGTFYAVACGIILSYSL